MHSWSGCESCYMMRLNFQDAIKETSEQINIHLKDRQMEAISSLLTEVIGTSFAANVIQLASPVSGDSSEVNSYWSCTRPFFPHPIHRILPFGILQYVQCILHGLTSVLLCVPFIFADSKKCRFGSST